MEADFSGYATKAGLKCSDGRTILPRAFQHQDKEKVPLVWAHGHKDPKNVLGYAILEHREKGTYAYAFFNNSEQGKNSRELVEHGDVDSLSIYANELEERNGLVRHGNIREVSLVLSGANPGAKIDNVNIRHSNGLEEESDEDVIIYSGEPIEHEQLAHSDDLDEDEEDDKDDATLEHDGEKSLQEIYDGMSDEQQGAVEYMIGAAVEASTSTGGEVSHADDSGETVQDIYNAMSEKQKNVVQYLIGTALDENSAEHSDTNEDSLTHQEGNDMTSKSNVFESAAGGTATKARPELSHDQIKSIMDDAPRLGSLRESFLAHAGDFLEHAGDYGIDDLDVLFPDATLDSNGISIISRRTEWVANVLTGTKHSPFSRIKSLAADLTADEARAKGYVKGSMKKDEVIKLLKRVTTPKTIYKKQKLDRDDILDITTVDIVAWLKAEMRIMLDEEIARAVLVGDGRDADDEDKIDEDHIRPIAYDNDMYTTKVNLADGILPAALVDAVVGALDGYKGSGTPTFYTTQRVLTSMLLAKDTLGRRLYPTKADLAGALLVKDIVPVEAMEEDADLVGVIVNLTDYTIGADAGGNVTMFDDFDIDFNQQKYLIETRISGALTKPKSAVALLINSGKIVTPTAPTFVSGTGVVTIPTQTGVVYTNGDTGTTLTAGAQTAIAPGAHVNIEAVPAAGYGLAHGQNAEWTFARP